MILFDLRKPTKPLGTAKELWTMWTTLTLSSRLYDVILRHVQPPSKQYPQMLPEQPVLRNSGEPAGAQALPCEIPQSPWESRQDQPAESLSSFLNPWCKRVCLSISLAQL